MASPRSATGLYIFYVIFVICLCSNGISATIRSVACCDTTLIQSTIASSNSGDVIALASGTFTGSCGFTLGGSGTALTVAGAGWTSTVIQCSTSTGFSLSNEGSGDAIANLTLVAPASGGIYGISAGSNSITSISGCYISGWTVGVGAAVGGTITMLSTTIANVPYASGSAGIVVSGALTATVCTLRDGAGAVAVKNGGIFSMIGGLLVNNTNSNGAFGNVNVASLASATFVGTNFSNCRPYDAPSALAMCVYSEGNTTLMCAILDYNGQGLGNSGLFMQTVFIVYSAGGSLNVLGARAIGTTATVFRYVLGTGLLRDASFLNCARETISVENATVTVSNVTWYGSPVYTPMFIRGAYANVTIQDSTFTNTLRAGGYGIQIYGGPGVNVVVRNFTGIRHGDAIGLTHAGRVDVYDSTFTDNWRAFCLHFHDCWFPDSPRPACLHIYNSTFVNNGNAGDPYGGAAIASLVPIVVVGSTFTGHTCTFGGTIALCAPGTIIGSTFINSNASTDDGGALYFNYNDWNTTLIRDSTFINCIVNRVSTGIGWGGTIMHRAPGALVITGTSITNGFAGYGGAVAIRNLDANVTITNCVFSRNTAWSAGDIFTTSSPPGIGSISIRNTSFSHSSAIGGYGGSISINTPLTIDSCTWTYSQAANPYNHGGAIYTDHSARVTNSSFSYCTGDQGGALHFNGPYQYSIIATSFSYNSASLSGDSIYLAAGNIYIPQNTTFVRTESYVGQGHPFQVDTTTAATSCSSFPAGTAGTPESLYACPGTQGYACVVNCATTDRMPGLSLPQSTCSGTSFVGDPCVNQYNVYSSWVAGRSTLAGGSNYGTLGQYSASNVIGPRRGVQFAVFPQDPRFVIAFGGMGYNEGWSASNNVQQALSDTWVVGSVNNQPYQVWMGGPRNTTATDGANFTTHTPPGRRVGVMWTDPVANMAYIHGGQNYGVVGDVWRTSVATPGQWEYMGGDLVGGFPGNFTHGCRVFHPNNWPATRVAHCAFQFSALPRSAFIMGGDGYYVDGTGVVQYGHLSDLWQYDMSTNQWAWWGGQVGAAVGANPLLAVRGTQNVPDVNNYPGARYSPATYHDLTKDVVYLFGGNSPTLVYNDLWRAQYNTTSGNVVWTWILGDTGAGVYPDGAPNAGFSTSYLPGGRHSCHIFMLTNLINAGGESNLYIFSGSASVEYLSDIWEVTVNDPVPAARWLAGNRAHDGIITFPSFQAPSAPYTPGARSMGILFSDPTRLGQVHVIGGLGSYSDAGPAVRPGNDWWIVNVARPTLQLTSTPASAVVGVTFTISGRLGYYLGRMSSTLNLPVNASVSVVGGSGTPQVTSGVFVNGQLSLTVWGSAPATYRITINNTDVSAQFTISVTCSTGCATCTASGLSATNCSACDYAGAHYTRSAISGVCLSACENGYYANSTGFCVPCQHGCATCVGLNLYYPDCLACDASLNYGVKSVGPCQPCNVGGNEFLANGFCTQCAPVVNCGTGNITCVGSTASCPYCRANYYKVVSAGQSDECVQCTDCTGQEYTSTNCSATTNAICSPCDARPAASYLVTACGRYNNAMYAACGAVANCAQAVTCTGPNDATCGSCANDFYLHHMPGFNDECWPCSTCGDGSYVAVPCSPSRNASCATCLPGCRLCTGATLSLPACLQCDEGNGYIINAAGTYCVAGCEVDEWTNHTVAGAHRCQACDVACATCSGADAQFGASGCNTCNEARGYLIAVDRGSCVAGCRGGQYQNTSEPKRCEDCSITHGTCTSGQYLSCADNTDYTCPACDTGCLTCTGPGLVLAVSGGECLSCDETKGYTTSDDGTACVPCAKNCSTCHGSPTYCSVCADGYSTAPGCAPYCESRGCLTCVAPNSCNSVCDGAYAGDGCMKCSGQAAVGSAYPNCVAARQTEAVSTGASMGLLAVLVVFVTIIVLRFPLPIFHSARHMINMPNARLPMVVDFVLSSRQFKITVDASVKISSMTLEGVGLLPGTISLQPQAITDSKEQSYVVEMKLTEKQTANMLAGGYHVDVTADAGIGPVTTKHVVRFPLRANGPNTLAVFTLIVEFIQLSSFCFGPGIGWWSADPVPSTLHYSLIQLPPLGGLWYIIFWAFAGVALFFSVVVVILKLKLDRKLYAHAAYVSFANVMYGTIMPFIGGVLYMPIISVMLSVMSCSKSVTDPSAQYTANFDSSNIVCWHSEHLVYAIVAVITILTFYPCAVFTLPVWQTADPKLDVRYFPRYLIATGQVKFVLAVTAQLFAKVPFIQSILLIVLSLPVIGLVLLRPPSVIYRLRWIVLASYSCVAWAGISSLVATLIPDSFISAIVLYSGWALVMIICLSQELRGVKDVTSKYEDPSAATAMLRIFDGEAGANNGGAKETAAVVSVPAVEDVDEEIDKDD